MAGCEDLAVELLTMFGGSTYVARFVADAMINQRSGIMLVADAPPISQPVFSVVHFRKRNAPNVQQALRLLNRRPFPLNPSTTPITEGI